MSPKARGIVPIAIVVCASVSALVFKGTTEWLVDLFVSACGGLACRMKTNAEPGEKKPGRLRRSARKVPRNARHRAARSGVRRPRAHRPARIRPVIEKSPRTVETAAPPEPEAIEVGLGV